MLGFGIMNHQPVKGVFPICISSLINMLVRHFACKELLLAAFQVRQLSFKTSMIAVFSSVPFIRDYRPLQYHRHYRFRL